MQELSPSAQSAIAFEIGKAALLGENVFNFGELLVCLHFCPYFGQPAFFRCTQPYASIVEELMVALG